MLISPTEPPAIRALGTTSSTPELYGCDILIVANKTRTGVQRKKFPEDLVASLADGRLYSQLPKMAALDRAVLILEGHGQWTMDGELVDRYARFTKTQLYGLVNSILWEFGVHVQTVRDVKETADYLAALEAWINKPKHSSLRTRPGAPKNSFGLTGEREQAAHILQGLPGVGVELAFRIYDHFGRVPLRWDCTIEELMKVRGVGKVKAARIYGALVGEAAEK